LIDTLSTVADAADGITHIAPRLQQRVQGYRAE